MVFLVGINKERRLFGLNPQTGQIFWKEAIYWDDLINDRKVKLGLFRGSILKLNNHFISLSELGTLLKLDFSKKGWKINNKNKLFFAPEHGHYQL